MATNKLESNINSLYPYVILATNNSGFIMNKICSRCKKNKKITKYKIDKRTPDGRTITCRDCYTNNKLIRFFRTSEQIESQRKKLLGRKYSLEHRMAISKGLLNSIKLPSVSDPDHFRMRIEYQLWRQNVIRLKGNLCELCSSNKRIHVHHIECFYDFPESRTDINNGQVLCQSCHMKLTWQQKRDKGARIHVNCKCPQHKKNNEEK